MRTPSLGSSPDTEALLYLCLRIEHSKNQLLGHCSDPLKLMGLNHPGVSYQLQKNYTGDESGSIIFLLCAFQKDNLLSRLLYSVFLTKLIILLSVSYSTLQSKQFQELLTCSGSPHVKQPLCTFTWPHFLFQSQIKATPKKTNKKKRQPKKLSFTTKKEESYILIWHISSLP